MSVDDIFFFYPGVCRDMSEGNGVRHSIAPKEERKSDQLIESLSVYLSKHSCSIRTADRLRDGDKCSLLSCKFKGEGKMNEDDERSI